MPAIRLIVLASLTLALCGAQEETGSKVCASCHPDVARKYLSSAMSRSSGKIGDGPLLESFNQSRFTDSASGAAYRLSISAEGYRLEFSRPGAAVEGERLLRWFVGSGRVGRSYIFSTGDFLFQAPVSYYSAAARWGVSPGYEQHQTIHLTRAVTAKCLQCHASRLQPAAGTENRFADPPFLEGGVSCERCHGPGQAHVKKMSAGDRSGVREIVNPARLEPARRDSVCAQCHLTGAARVARMRAPGAGFRAGERLTDYTIYFVWTGGASATSGANSHFEKLARSACQRSSGDRMWCGTCHDPHGEPEAGRRAEYYRSRCRQCHGTSAAPECSLSAEARGKAQDDCAGCHMPKGQVRETEHAVFTDHSIPRRAARPDKAPAGAPALEPFWNAAVDDRDYGLAYAMAAEGDPALRRRALGLLEKAAARHPEDVPVLIQLAGYYDGEGREDEAMALDERILQLDPAQTAVAVNLGAGYMKRGRAADAMRLWQGALARNPGLTAARVNLAVAQYRGGDAEAARSSLRKALQYDPDAPAARRLLREIQAGGN